ncbi:hypothetical protein BDP27DRAFT_1353585 [Rhodocollybia butyracea]|uniref:Phospholipid-transporting ATPase n=1 Tax=Rhodocollybia butyracea TaxID=206335 RepID=A0A9P5P4P7_9AGAR|nr:hypothetical protein BDP27DRAFT_1353585 [Rhodocollybia butyracea]
MPTLQFTKTMRLIFIWITSSQSKLPEEYYNTHLSWFERVAGKGKSRRKVKKEHIYTSNKVVTSKYTILTFVPRNVLEQFRRVANIYLLGIVLLQFFGAFITVNPLAFMLPLFTIIILTALKDRFEDFRRHQADKRVNQSVFEVLGGSGWTGNPNWTKGHSRTFFRGLPFLRQKPKLDTGFEPNPDDPSVPSWLATRCDNIHVGDIVRITENQPIPADILICSTSDPKQIAYIETNNLDGEINLKSKKAVDGLTHLKSAVDCTSGEGTRFRVECECPEANMHHINGVVKMVEGAKYPVNFKTMLLRGAILRNTSWVIGVVLFTGKDTKIVMNAGGTPSKRSNLERQMNTQVLINIALTAVLALVCAIADSRLEKRFAVLGAPWLYDIDLSGDNPTFEGFSTWVSALLSFQNLVPVSLYLSIEVVHAIQAIWIHFDKDIAYDRPSSVPSQPAQTTQARNWNLSDDLGQIEYIFSDKTGTLTQNSMVFKHSVSAKFDETKGESHSFKLKQDQRTRVTPRPAPTDATPSFEGPRDKDRFKDAVLSEDIALASSYDAPSPTFTGSLDGFFTVLALCHTALASPLLRTHSESNFKHKGEDRGKSKCAISRYHLDEDIGETREYGYKAQSPDEAVLVQAAADVGYVFLGKKRERVHDVQGDTDAFVEVLELRTPICKWKRTERYELLHVLEFSSVRKRMSIIVRKLAASHSTSYSRPSSVSSVDSSRNDETRKIFLFTKGADDVIFERLVRGVGTQKHLEGFANEGLRTLTLGFRHIKEDEYTSWSHAYHEICNKIEKDLQLLGATGIEDKLQDGAAETIRDLKRAGIKIWVATGDNLETAIATGRSTNLIGPNSNVIIVRGGAKPVDQQLNNILERFFPEYESLKDYSDLINVGPSRCVLIIDGAALFFSSPSPHSSSSKSVPLCEGVIGCRVSPLQKSGVVKLVKDNLHVMTLAIGDGANDVSMIQAADVGVGIFGEEGLQAVNSSDYAIAQFRFLKKLLLVHGHWSYARNGTMILNFWYKNVVPTGIVWWFQIYCAWSASYAMDYNYILFWNFIWTIAPVVGIGLFDRVLGVPKILMDIPELYHYGRERYWFRWRDFYLYMLDGLYQSTSARKDGYSIDLYEWSTVTAVSGVLVVDIFTGMCASAWTWWLVFLVFIGILAVWAFTLTNLSGLYVFLGVTPYFWFSLLITFILALTPRYLKDNPHFDFKNCEFDQLSNGNRGGRR